MSVVKAKLGFFEVQFEGLCWDAVELGESSFGITPERLDAVDVAFTGSEFVVAVVDPEMLVETDIDQAIIATPAVGMDDRTQVDFAPDHRLERGFGAIGDDFGVDLALAFEDTEDDGFAGSAAPAFAPDPVRAKVRFIDFDSTGQRRIGLTSEHDSPPGLKEDVVDGADRHPGQFSGVRSGKIEGKIADNLPEFCRGDF